MRPIRIFLLLRLKNGEWISSSHRDFDEVLSAWEAARQNSGTVGIIHVGISRPQNGAFESVASHITDCIVLTSSARWAFNDIGTYSGAISFVEGLSLHVALTGWGYTNSSNDIIKSVIAERTDDAQHFSSPWLSNFCNINPTMAREALIRGVRDDSSYQSHEKSLSWEMRCVLGNERMNYLMRGLDVENPIHVASACPPWLLSTPIDLINATVRCSNSLRSAEISWVSDLLKITIDDLMKIPNFGRKSLRDLAMAILSTAKRGPILIEGQNEKFQLVEQPSGIGRFVVKQDEVGQLDLADKPYSMRSFKFAFESNLSQLKENQLTVLRQRIGTEGGKLTLEEISSEMGNTRERVRQIEAKAIQILQMDRVWETEVAARLESLLQDREDPLPALSLNIFDPWFSDIENLLPELKFIFERILNNRFSMLDINGCQFITRITKNEWQAAIREGTDYLEHALPERPTKLELRHAIEALLPNKGSELASEFWSTVQTIAVFSKDASGTERLAGIGTSAESFVGAVLASSDRPLHYSEIPDHIQKAFGRTIDVRRAHNAARNVGILLGRGTFGTRQHCPLSFDEMAVLCQESEEIVLSGAKERQWSCYEILEKLGGRGLDFEERINQYVIHLALQESTVLSNLGRFVWAQSGERPSGTHDRIDITQAILSLLQAAGKPLTRNEIRAALLRDRGLSGYFQIQPRGSLVRVGEGLWGILERDIPLTNDEMINLRTSIVTLLDTLQLGIHVTEIHEHLHSIAPYALKVEDPFAILSVLLLDSRFKFSTSGYLFLAVWAGSRRLSQGDAVIEILRQSNKFGLKASEVASRASTLLGRAIGKENVYAAMAACGAKFDQESGRWILNDENEIEADDTDSKMNLDRISAAK